MEGKFLHAADCPGLSNFLRVTETEITPGFNRRFDLTHSHLRGLESEMDFYEQTRLEPGQAEDFDGRSSRHSRFLTQIATGLSASRLRSFVQTGGAHEVAG